MALRRRPDGATKQRKRLGRGPGSGNGTTAGKGTKGQNARSGGGVRPGFEGGQMPLYRRIARRGFSNHPFKTEYTAINLSTLEKRFESGATVNYETLLGAGVISASERLVKILANGEITKKLTVSGLKVSASARAKIEAAGGSVVEGEPTGTETAEAGAPAVAAEEPTPEAETEQTKDEE